ncbi:uncharacterized protein LOC143293009 [Babylonia areolata]|uniref:uncharacterized protein LOC143293009 n=1 Tax=Babylonia areolata TaxID=304850 RepID=UPI003FD32801
MASLVTWWRSHHMLHRLGAMGVLLATFLFLLGFSVPAWTTGSGLWMTCSPSSCMANLHSPADGWMTTVRVMECIALLAYVLCCVMEILQDCFHYNLHSPYDRAVEILGGIAGVTSLTGATVFGIWWSNIGQTVLTAAGSHSVQSDHPTSTLHWGFGMVITASIIILLSVVAICVVRCKHMQATSSTKYTSGPKAGRIDFIDEGTTFRHFQDPDTSSMMLVPASHFVDTPSRPQRNDQRSDPPPYALPPPYPYPSSCDFFLPIANSSMVAPTSDTTSVGGQSQVTNAADQSLSVASADRALAAPPPQSFISSTSTLCIQNKPRLVMRPLFIKTCDGDSQIEITPSAQNSSGLPSPFSHF